MSPVLVTDLEVSRRNFLEVTGERLFLPLEIIMTLVVLPNNVPEMIFDFLQMTVSS